MPNLPISGLPTAGPLDGTEQVGIVQAGVTSQATVGAIAALGGGGITRCGGVTFSGHDPDLIFTSVNVASVTRLGPGEYLIDFNPNYFDGTNIFPLVSAKTGSNSYADAVICNIVMSETNQASVQCGNPNTSSLTDPDVVTVLVIGVGTT